MSIQPLYHWRHIGVSFLVAVCYFCSAKAGLAFAIPPGNATVIWPPSGIAVAALLLLGYRLAPAVWIGSCLVNLTTNASVAMAMSFATGNTLEAILAVWLLRRFVSRLLFAKARDAFVFLLIAAFSCVPAATTGAISMLLGGRIGSAEVGVNWATWFLGDLAGMIVIVPLIVAVAEKRWTSFSLIRGAELLLLFVAQVVLSFLLFGGLLPERFAGQILYLPMVLLIWCSLRFRLFEVTASTVLFFTAAIWGTCLGIGAYASSAAQESLFDLQLLLLTYAVTSLVVTSIVTGRQAAQTASRRSQDDLRRAKADHDRLQGWFRQLMTASPDALIMSNSDGRIQLVNEAAERLFGYSRAEMVGQPIELLIPPRHRVSHEKHRAGYLDAPHVRMMGTGIELTGCRKDGTEFPVEISLGPTNTDEGLVIFSAVRDVSLRKRAEEALRSSEERFELAVKGTDVGIWDWNLRTNRVFFSPRWKSILGYADDEIRHDLNEWESRLHPEDRERALETVEEYLSGKSTDYELEHRLRHKDGSYRWILARGAAVYEAPGKPTRMVGSHLDITDRKEMEEKLRVQMARLIAAEGIQSHLLPEKAPDIDGFDIAGKCYPAEFAAGDHFDFLFLNNGRFVPVIGDVSGHGIGPAILMASLHAHLQSLAEVHTDLCELIARANESLLAEFPEQYFVTLLAGLMDCQARTLSYVRCGHPPGFVMNAAGEVTAWMNEGGLPLGILPDVQICEGECIELRSGDVVVMLTDGILEAYSPDRVQFGVERTVQVVREHRERKAVQIIEALREAVDDYMGHSELPDDITVLIIKVT